MKLTTPFPYLIILTLILSFTPTFVKAETQYVSDRLVITVRTGKGTEYQIIKTLVSGDRVEVLNTEDGYSYVETSDGLEGWVRSQYLKDEPAAKEKLNSVNSQLKNALSELNKTKENYASLNAKYKTLSQQHSKLSAEKEKLDKEVARINEIAKKPIIFERQNRELQHKNVNLEKDLQRLNQENNSLKDRSQREWFIVGALVLFIGIVLGLVIPKLRSKKRSAW